MQIESTRFGRVEIADDAVINFPDGLIGLPGTRYALIAQTESSVFLWLHSVDDPAVALPVANPWLFFGNYEVEVSDEDAEKLRLEARRTRTSSASSAPPTVWRSSPSTCAARWWSTARSESAVRSSTRPATSRCGSRCSPRPS